MAAGFLPDKGSEYAPCEPDCRTPSPNNPRPLPSDSDLVEHLDCAALRRRLAHPCRLCGQPIGYGGRFYQDPEAPVDAPTQRTVANRRTMLRGE